MMDIDPRAPKIPYVPPVPGMLCGVSVNYMPGHKYEAIRAAEVRVRHWLAQQYPDRTIKTLTQTDSADDVMTGHPIYDNRAPRTLDIRYRVTFEVERPTVDLAAFLAGLPPE